MATTLPLVSATFDAVDDEDLVGAVGDVGDGEGQRDEGLARLDRRRRSRRVNRSTAAPPSVKVGLTAVAASVGSSLISAMLIVETAMLLVVGAVGHGDVDGAGRARIVGARSRR